MMTLPVAGAVLLSVLLQHAYAADLDACTAYSSCLEAAVTQMATCDAISLPDATAINALQECTFKRVNARIGMKRMLTKEVSSMKTCTASKKMTDAESAKNRCRQARLTNLQTRTNRRTARRGKRALSTQQRENRKLAITALRDIRAKEREVNRCVNKAKAMYRDCNVFKSCCSGIDTCHDAWQASDDYKTQQTAMAAARVDVTVCRNNVTANWKAGDKFVASDRKK